MAVVRQMAEDIREELIAFRRDLHMHPEVSMQEFRTTEKIVQALEKMGISCRRFEPTGVMAEIHGKGDGKTVALRADMDALTITEDTGLPFASVNPGVMHACGHDSHTAMLLGAVKILNKLRNEFSGTVRFLFQPGEESGEGAAALIEQGAAQGVDHFVGIHVNPMVRPGMLGFCPGPQLAASDRFCVHIKSKGSHGAMPQFGVDSIYVAAEIITALQTVVSRFVDPMKAAVVTVGVVKAGSRWNVMAGEAYLEGTVRYMDVELQKPMEEKMRSLIEGIAKSHGAQAELEYIIGTRPVITDRKVTEIAIGAARKVVDNPEKDIYITGGGMGGDDFGNFCVLAPSTCIKVGAGGTSPVHTPAMAIDESVIPLGAAAFVQTALDLLWSKENGA